jgi:hypothetical protein
MSTLIFIAVLGITSWWTGQPLTAKPETVIWIAIWLALAAVSDITRAINEVAHQLRLLNTATKESNRSMGSIIRSLLYRFDKA